MSFYENIFLFTVNYPLFNYYVKSFYDFHKYFFSWYFLIFLVDAINIKKNMNSVAIVEQSDFFGGKTERFLKHSTNGVYF